MRLPWKIHTSSAAAAEPKHTPPLRSSKTPENNKKPVSPHGTGTDHQVKAPLQDFLYGLPFTGAALCISGTTESQLSQRVYRGISYAVNTSASLIPSLRTIRHLQTITTSPAALVGLFSCHNTIPLRSGFLPFWGILEPVKGRFYLHYAHLNSSVFHQSHSKAL